MGNTVSRKSYLFTSESVSEGHPDKVCDRISDEVVDLFFREGPKDGMSPWDIRAACETLCTTNRVVIAGETRGPFQGRIGFSKALVGGCPVMYRFRSPTTTYRIRH